MGFCTPVCLTTGHSLFPSIFHPPHAPTSPPPVLASLVLVLATRQAAIVGADILRRRVEGGGNNGPGAGKCSGVGPRLRGNAARARKTMQQGGSNTWQAKEGK
ncbi:hypothetical protein U9M48_002133, partial [Paspalum notatum var. saurae]